MSVARDTCSVEGCERAVRCKGLCKRHYDRARRGEPMESRPYKYRQRTATTKECNRCHQELPLSVFCKNSASRDGYGGMCLACKRAYNVEHRYFRETVMNGFIPELQRWVVRRGTAL